MATIESNFESICINPNDDLVLYKKEIIRSRIEKFLYAICSSDTDDLPTPLSRIEELYNCLVTGGDIPTFTPLSRAEKFVMAMLGAYDVELLPTPISRSETLMKKIATGDNNLDDIDNLQSRYEFLLAYIIKAGGFNGGNGDFYYNLTSLTSSFTTIYGTLDKPVKNAVLRGQTLVNLVKKPTPENLGNNQEWGLQGSSKPTHTWNSNGSITITSTLKGSIVLNYYNLTLFKPNTEYTLFVSVGWNDVGVTPRLSKISTNDIPLNNGLNIVKFTTVSDLAVQNLPLRLGYAGTVEVGCEYTFNDIMVLEGDWTNVDIPYFEGMTSVKMPVLTTTGKNLFDINKFKSIGIDEQGYYIPLKFVDNSAAKATLKLKPNTKYVVTGTYIYTGKARFTFRINDGAYQNMNNAFETDATGVVNIKIGSNNVDVSDPSKMEKIMIVESTLKDIYEPYKSNILTCNEEVTLRGIGDVRDELDLLTGEVVNKFGEIVLNGDESWGSYGSQSNQVNTVAFKLSHTNHNSSWDTGLGCCDKILFTNGNVIYGQDLEGVTTDANNIIVRVSISKASSVDEFKAWLSNNNIRVVYPLKEEVIKTVDLSIVDQDRNDTKLSTFNDITHVIVSSEGLIPTGEIDIARPIQFVDYSLDDGEATLYNTIDYPVKSAILKGNTLVNVLSATNIKVSSKSAKIIKFNVQPNVQKRYVLFFKLNKIPTISNNSDNEQFLKFEWYHASASGGFYSLQNKNVVLDKTMTINILPYTGVIQRTNFSVWCRFFESGELDMDVMII